MNKKKYLLVLFFLGLLTQAQSPLPTVELQTLNGQLISTDEIASNNQLMIISLWATWCVPCKNELDAVAEVYEDWVSETDIKYFAISIDDSRTSKRIKPMVDGKDWEFEILLDENSELKRAFGVSTVPFTVIVKNGLMVYKHTGYTPGYEDELYEQILKFSQ
ncbi:MAG: TlpA disulfide reductase family protein [Bacteroidetes bacterium]|nr:TlpA disulfide reductase family protein [Bacteroidota bacterium]MDA0860453.1 TlpA disulfide reductase family protein [Bacteroidota bacterium]MDA1318665.1 TlpA disulfide reductase family protein [Bacteroidota bacterium]